eukprot:XP_011661113.1 PREDICTED: uncharacterized protein LOC105436820 [Strongylocentrotus purpuratus]
MMGLVADMVHDDEDLDFVDDDGDDDLAMALGVHPVGKRRWKDFWKKVQTGGRKLGHTLLSGANHLIKEDLDNADMMGLVADMVHDDEDLDFVDDDGDDDLAMALGVHPVGKRRWKDFWKKVQTGGRKLGHTLLSGANHLISKVAAKNPLLGSVLALTHDGNTRSKRYRLGGNSVVLKRKHECN